MTDEDAELADEEMDELDDYGSVQAKYAVRLVDATRVFDVSKRKITALQGANLEVRPGEYVVVHGPSGSGKTTLLNIIGALDRLTSGRVLVMDVPIADYDESFRATFRLANTGFVFQSYNLISTLTTVENVMFPMQLSELPLKKATERATELLTAVGLADRLDHLPWQLSSGEQQRVAIARATANDPPIILADEPTANLDESSADMIRTLLDDLNKKGKTLIVMTHDEEIIRRPGSSRYRMERGAITQDA